LSLQPFDEAYVRRLRDGDQETAQNFNGYFRPLLAAKLRRRVRSAQLIEDVIQETFLRVLRNIEQPGALDHPERLGAYIIAVCNNVLLEFFRREMETVPIPEPFPEPPNPRPGPEQVLVTEELQKLVRKIIDGLEERDRCLLTRIFLEEKDKDLVCEELHVTREYLRVLLHRALAKFRGAYLASTMRAGA